MADDIVTRLRNLCVPDDSKWLESMPTDRLMLEAADEIQSLRAKLALTEDEMVRMARIMSEMTESYRRLRDEYVKVRGDA